MRKLALFFFISCIYVCAQTPRAEVFGGYSLLHEPGANFNGWNGAATFNVYRCLGITADFSGHYWSQSIFGFDIHNHIYSYTFGPTASFRNQTRFTPFLRFLAGGSHISSSSSLGSDSVDRFTVVGGGGLDITLNRRFAVRPVQLDYHGVRVGGSWMNNMRYSAGVVFRFGEKK